MSGGRSDQIERSWIQNGPAWTRAVRTDAIESRRKVTDEAILKAVAAQSPHRVLDVGCGEGWLVRALDHLGMQVVGIDASEPLIAAASQLGGGVFHVISYEDLIEDPSAVGIDFDVAVFNFSLFDEDVLSLLQAAGRPLADGGSIVIQTAHPWTARGDDAYQDGWRTETFADFEGDFTAPMPWYYRTVASWLKVIDRAGLRVTQLTEPADPSTQEPLSLLIVCRPQNV